MQDITLTTSDIERLASSALDLDKVFDTDNDGGYVTLLDLLEDVGIDRAEIRDAAEQGIVDFLEREKGYTRRQIEEALANYWDDAICDSVRDHGAVV